MLNSIYLSARGVKELFSELVLIDWYDGYTRAIGKVRGIDKWFICNLTYYHINQHRRIFTLIETDEKFVAMVRLKLNDSYDEGRILTPDNVDETIGKCFPDYDQVLREVEKAFREYAGEVYLMNCSNLNDIDYELVEIPLNEMHYFRDIESVLEQDEASSSRWVNLFSPGNGSL